MIAIARIEPPCGSFAAEARRRVGGRALAVSEYASRFFEALSRFMELSELHHIFGGQKELSHDDLENLVTLDGQIEALRIRLGIPSLPIVESIMFPGRSHAIGFSHLKIVCKCEKGPFDDRYTCADEDWWHRMKSLKAAARELAVTPELDNEEREIVELLLAVGHRMTTTQILTEFNNRDVVKAESTIKGKLAN